MHDFDSIFLDMFGPSVIVKWRLGLAKLSGFGVQYTHSLGRVANYSSG